MELDQFRHLVKVAEAGNFTRAAESLGMSQPALSRSIARLEEELGQPVFERQTRGVILTDAGRVVHQRALQILAIVEDLSREIQDDGQTGRIRVAAIPTIAPYLLPPLLRDFRRDFPRSTVIVHEDTTEHLLKRLSDGEVDVALLSRPLHSPYLTFEDLFDEELYLVLSDENPLARRKSLSLTDLEGIPFVLLGEAHCLSGRIQSVCEQRSIHPVTIERTSQLASVLELVALNHGVSLIPAMARACDTNPRRVYRSLNNPPTRTITMAWNPYRFTSKLMQSFLGRVRECGQLGESVRS